MSAIPGDQASPPNQVDRLHVAVNSAVNPSGELIIFNLTARGKPKSSETKDITEWFDLGREWVVRGFAPHLRIDRAVVYPVELLRGWLTLNAKGGGDL